MVEKKALPLQCTNMNMCIYMYVHMVGLPAIFSKHSFILSHSGAGPGRIEDSDQTKVIRFGPDRSFRPDRTDSI